MMIKHKNTTHRKLAELNTKANELMNQIQASIALSLKSVGL